MTVVHDSDQILKIFTRISLKNVGQNDPNCNIRSGNFELMQFPYDFYEEMQLIIWSIIFFF